MNEKRTFQKKKGCRYCIDNEVVIDYKDRYTYQYFLTERFKLVPRRVSGLCAGHQRVLSRAVKRARHVALVPYSTSQS